MNGETPSGKRTGPEALRRWAAPATAAILLAVRVHRLFDPYLIVDDAFISFRYADNLARGLGLVYNPGERVEGYSNFLWTVLLAAGARLGIDIVQLSILLALLAALAGVALLWAWSASLFEDGVVPPDNAVAPGDGATPAGHAAPGGTRTGGAALLIALPPLLYAATGSQARYVVSGMETLLFGFLVAAAAWLLVLRDAPLAAGCTFALAAMTRPEGAMYWLVAAGIALLPAAGSARQAPLRNAGPPRRRPRRRRVLLLAAGFAAPFGTYFAWRWLYYGYPLPNTFYAKAAGFSWTRLARGRESLAEVASWWSIYPVVVAATAALPSLISPKTPASARRSESLRLAAAYVAVTAVYFVYVGGDFLLFFGPRFLMPALPFALLLGTEGLRNLAGLPSRWPALADRARRRWQLAVTWAGALVLAGNALWLSWPSRYFDAPRLSRLMESWADLGRWTGAATPADTVIADGGAGIVPFYSRRVNIDMYGLTDLHIGHMAPLPVGFKITAHEKYDPRYVLARRPDLLVTSLGRDRTPGTAGLARVKDWVWACYRPWALLRAFPGPDGAMVLPSRAFTGALFDQGYWTAVLERRHGRASVGCAAYERAMGVPPATSAPGPGRD